MPVVTSRDLDAVLANKPRELTLLPEEPDLEAQRRLLNDLPFGNAMALAAERHEVDGLLLAAVVEMESRFRPTAVSPRGAVGLMQVLPATGAMYGRNDLSDPHVNLDVGSRYLRRLLRDYDGDLELALAAYNAGPAAVERYHGVPPFRETRDYVKRVLRRYEEHQRSLDGSALAPL
ncbi:MAG TPA: lytic transglycosylase domain-containing protein [Thermoanaerobaculia bacterium]|nr:lytic transglycosylase domain-containing protein [Thermoanaerobaculia bacterium]